MSRPEYLPERFVTVFATDKQENYRVDFFSNSQIIFVAYNVQLSELQPVISIFLDTGMVSYHGLVYGEMGQ